MELIGFVDNDYTVCENPFDYIDFKKYVNNLTCWDVVVFTLETFKQIGYLENRINIVISSEESVKVDNRCILVKNVNELFIILSDMSKNTNYNLDNVFAIVNGEVAKVLSRYCSSCFLCKTNKKLSGQLKFLNIEKTEYWACNRIYISPVNKLKFLFFKNRKVWVYEKTNCN